jgi:phosphoglycerol geranylgeranyltransferase
VSRDPHGTTWQRLQATASDQGAAVWQLFDPERTSEKRAAETAAAAAEIGCDAFLIGASTGSPVRFASVVRAVKQAVELPVVIFPGEAAQVVPHADAILFLSLLSGRNPQYLVVEQVRAAPLVAEYRLEAIPTCYLLIESGRTSAVEFISGTRPIPREQPQIASAHALAARYLGMQLVYLEAGSGAPRPVPEEMVRACCCSDLPLAVGGGIRRPAEAVALVRAGARFIVVGNQFEPEPDWGLFREFVDAIHHRTPLAV